jgi:hypothetical protein
MVDDSNMGRIEALFYKTLEDMGIVISGKLRRLPEVSANGAIKEYIVTLKYPDDSTKTITVDYDLDAYSKIVKFAKGEA